MQALLAIGTYFALIVTASWLVGFGGSDTAKQVEHGMLALLLASAIWLPITVMRPPGVPMFGTAVLARSAALYVLFLAVWVPFTWLAYPAVMQQLGYPLEPQPQLGYFASAPATAWGPWVAVLVVCVIGPLTEELLFRGYLQGMLRRVLPRGLALVLTAAVFGLFHGVQFAVPIGMLGLLFGALRERFGCLEASVFVHALHNTATVVLTWIFPSVLQAFQS